MTCEFTTNATARMRERGISEEEIRAALETPDHLGPWLEGRWRAVRRLNGRALEVVFVRDRFQCQIHTAFWQEPSA
jgi:hypothetical protein